MGQYVIGLTGASGAIYASRLIGHLKGLGHEVLLVASASGVKVAQYEGQAELFKQVDKQFDNEDFFAPISSGSYRYSGMIIIPCSMGTLGKVALGSGDSLLTRAADVCLKEGRKLILAPRETPLSLIHLKNMCALVEAGAKIVPACPHFYHHPQNLNELVDTVLARILDLLEVEHSVSPRWREN